MHLKQINKKMAYQKLQVSGGLSVIPSATVRIPDPSTQVLTGVADFSVASTLTDAGTTFLTAGIQTNAIVYNTTAQIAYYITDVTDDLNIALSPATTGGATDSYVIYNAATIGCILYVGTAGNATVLMADQNGVGGSEITFTNLPNASFLPTQVIRVAATTTATDIIALW
jgi:hypothetical protein|tara:strand:+ start:132 stop:641 length:510 start_codon:yes stop_codon:yes gene_type:complete